MVNRFVHSYWSIPTIKNRWDIDNKLQTVANMWYFATSFAYLKKLDQDVVLYTDDYGKKLLGHIPYNFIYTSLNDLKFDVNSAMWEYGKMYVMNAEPAESIHIDGDVFIKTEDCLNLLNNECDLIVENIDNVNNSEDHINSLDSIKHLRFPKGTNKELSYAYSTGIILFKNEEFKNMFLNTYFKFAQKINGSVICQEIYKRNKNISPDLILEQKFLYDLSKDMNVKTLLKDNDPNDIGYQHVKGKDKYLQLSICKRVLKNIDPELYEKCMIVEKNIINE